MRTNRFLVAAAAITAVMLGLVGCSGGGSGGTEAGSTALPNKDVKATVNIWGYNEPKLTPWIVDAIAAMESEYKNVDVKYTYIPYDQIASKVLGTAVSGGSPDGIFYNPADAANLAQSGVLADMSPYWNSFADKDQIPKSVQWVSDGKLVSLQGYVNTTALYYNKAILDSLGLKPPTTVNELDKALKLVSGAGYGGMTMCAVPNAESEFQIFPWMLGEGLNYGAWDKAKLTSVFSKFRDWISKGYIPQDVVGWTQGDAFDKFSSGKFAFTQNGNWQLGAAKKLPFEWGVVPIPAGADGSHSIGGGEGFSLVTKSKMAPLTWHFFEQALLTKKGELSILAQQGSIPVRKDAASADTISSDPSLTVYAQVVADMGVRPSTSKIGEYLVKMGKIWNAVAGGQTAPGDAAQQVIDQLSNVK